MSDDATSVSPKAGLNYVYSPFYLLSDTSEDDNINEYIDLSELKLYPKMLNLVKNKDKETLEIVERVMKKNESEKLEIVERIIKREETEKRAIIERREASLQLESICGIRGGLEFILSKNNNSSFEEPIDKVLSYLSKDKDFTDFLETSCRKNHLKLEDVKKCIGGLYHTASKHLHGHGNIVINEQSWSTNEIFSLAVIFEYYEVPWTYSGNFPFKIGQ
ncbi:6977_t:CDS:2 [Scutellospora calospora]|uniref:6977_t:CDS:1 n=1 Tax=Scutellospora calospora TaxID=85575 RepID=A0ACA9KM32_9GLOM|nr:6977_t:CDS:2 [Scutellospora calospora]